MKDLASLIYNLTETPAKTIKGRNILSGFFMLARQLGFLIGGMYVKSCAVRVN